MNHFYTAYNLKENEVLLIPYGSKVYGTNNESSDEDYLAITNKNLTKQEYRHNKININLFSTIDFQE